MGFKSRKHDNEYRKYLTSQVTLRRTDGLVFRRGGLPYEAGEAISLIMDRAARGLRTEVNWKEDGKNKILVIPQRR